MVISMRQKNDFYFQLFLKMRKYLLDMRKDFLIMSNFYLVIEILSKQNSLAIVASKKILKTSNYELILSIFFLIMRIKNLQCIKAPERRWRLSDVFIFNFEHIWHLFQVFLLLSLNK